jgi:hypothetical protein
MRSDPKLCKEDTHLNSGIMGDTHRHAGDGGRAVPGMNCLRTLERWDHGFESHSRHACLCVRLFCVCVVLCERRRPAMG